VPRYARITVPKTSPASSTTQNKIHTVRIKDEIKFLHLKKDKLNQLLYKAHLKAAQEWGNAWPTIIEYINTSINKTMTKYKTINDKLKKLKPTNPTPPGRTEFYPRVVNKTDIIFNPNELNLLNKGLKYNLSFKRKNWIEKPFNVILIVIF
jgi:hypothetical protein